MSLVAAGAIITPGTIVGKENFGLGTQPKFIQKISDTEEKLLINTPKVYEKLK